ncbi:MAG: prepilin-type N-terminal cleavage/methylation domain-containing protein, partial [Thermodesulfovibrio sp.]|nr:prepilin-type N-terminal cleavage/methylation domain-containing protein [Thermodesulfovibrio sp.]
MKLIRNNNGLTLVEVAIVLVILGLLIGLGASLIGPLTKRAKLNDTQERLNANVESIISWSAGNKRLPTASEFASVIRNPNDA